jgi:2-dehydropantoate 2-reductase
MKIGVMGTGGVGGYFGALLARAGFDIHFIARGKHLQAIQEEGLQVVSDQGSFGVRIHATSEPYDIETVDLILFCVKSYDTEDAARLIEPMVDDDTMILSLQNGIDNTDKLIRRFGSEKVRAGTVFVEAAIASPGVVAHSGEPARTIFGGFTEEQAERGKEILEAFQKAGIDAELTEDIQRVLWTKFLFICGVHGVSTLSRSPLGSVLECPETRELMIGVMREVETLARHRGVSLPKRVVTDAIILAESYPRGFKCSMLRDLEWRRQMEIEALNGMVVKLGKKSSVETPLNLAIYACLKLENEKILKPFFINQMED